MQMSLYGMKVARRLYAAGKAQLPDLPYDYNALEPVISAEIMRLHHAKHHATYVSNLNVALEKLHQAEAHGKLSEQISLQAAIKFNGGGHLNHSIFWENLCPTAKYADPSGTLKDLIVKRFGSLSDLQHEMSTKAAAVQGSGWGWLIFNKETKMLDIMTTANQDPVAAVNAHCVPLLGIDVWEHAYYLQYKNVRPDYLKAIWQVVNWKDVASRLPS